MPVPGQPRNPDGETPFRFHRIPGVPLAVAGRSPGTMRTSLRGNVLAYGQVRQLWRQTINYLAAQSPVSWTANTPGRGGPGTNARGFQITRALRYMARSFYVAGGTDNTRLSELHTIVVPRVRSKQVTVAGGSKRSQPTVRNRLTSFGARVQPINARVRAADGGEE